MHHRGVIAQPPPVAHAEVEWRTGDDDDVGLLEGIAPGAVEIVRIARGQQPAGRPVHVAGDVEALEQRDGLLVAPAHPDLGTEQDGGPLGFHQQLRQLFDIGGVADGFGGCPIVPRPRDDGFLHRHLSVKDVAWNLQITRPGRTGEALPDRHGDHVGDALGGAHARRKLGDRRGNIHVRQVLQRTHLVLGQRTLPADVQHGALGTQRGGDAGERVGEPRPRRGDHAAQTAGLARVAVRGVGGDLFMAHVDDADVVVDATVVGVDDVSAAEREDRVHACVREGRSHQVPAGYDAGIPALPRQGVLGCRGSYSFFRCARHGPLLRSCIASPTAALIARHLHRFTELAVRLSETAQNCRRIRAESSRSDRCGGTANIRSIPVSRR